MEKLLTAFFILSSLSMSLSSVPDKPTKKPITRPNAVITVMGFVYCDTCSNNSFSRHSYFLPGKRKFENLKRKYKGAEVKIKCEFRADSSRADEQISFSVNRTTNNKGLYKFEIPSVDGISCAEAAISSYCRASLIRSSLIDCNVPGYKTTTDQFAIKSKQANLCFYCLDALSFRPLKLDLSLCK